MQDFVFFTIKKNLFSDLFIETIAEVSRVPMEYLNIIIRLFTVCVPLFYTAYIPLKEILFFDNKNICRMFFIPAFCSRNLYSISIQDKLLIYHKNNLGIDNRCSNEVSHYYNKAQYI